MYLYVCVRTLHRESGVLPTHSVLNVYTRTELEKAAHVFPGDMHYESALDSFCINMFNGWEQQYCYNIMYTNEQSGLGPKCPSRMC